MSETARGTLAPWAALRIAAEEYRELDSERVLVFNKSGGRGRRSGLELGALERRRAHLFHVQAGKVTRLLAYDVDRERARADLGLEE